MQDGSSCVIDTLLMTRSKEYSSLFNIHKLQVTYEKFINTQCPPAPHLRSGHQAAPPQWITSRWYDATDWRIEESRGICGFDKKLRGGFTRLGKFGLWSWNKTFKGFPKLKKFANKKLALPCSTMQSWWKVWWNKYLNTYNNNTTRKTAFLRMALWLKLLRVSYAESCRMETPKTPKIDSNRGATYATGELVACG